ncbi:MAG: thioredoxin domain-containing protein [Planctomycetota bacterium]
MADPVVQITDESFEEETIAGNVLVMIDFVSDWCGESQKMIPLVDELATRYPGQLKTRRIDIDRSAETAVRCNVLNTPAILFFRDGEELDRLTGKFGKTRLISTLESLLEPALLPRRRARTAR